jgi:transcriptional regulator NrdR family protein
MISINSPNEQTRVINSRTSKKKPLVWRRRQGIQSGVTFTTYERPSLAENKPVQLDDGTDIFNLGRLILSISQAFSHDEHAAKYDSLWLAQTIEEILSVTSESLNPSLIAKTTHDTLKRFDQLAAVQYAAQHHLISSVRRRGRPSIA